MSPIYSDERILNGAAQSVVQHLAELGFFGLVQYFAVKIKPQADDAESAEAATLRPSHASAYADARAMGGNAGVSFVVRFTSSHEAAATPGWNQLMNRQAAELAGPERMAELRRKFPGGF